jgi:hypothetical protein
VFDLQAELSDVIAHVEQLQGDQLAVRVYVADVCNEDVTDTQREQFLMHVVEQLQGDQLVADLMPVERAGGTRTQGHSYTYSRRTHTYLHTYIQTDSKQTDLDRHRQTPTHRHKHTRRLTDRQTHSRRHRQTHTRTHRQTHSHRHTLSHKDSGARMCASRVT